MPPPPPPPPPPPSFQKTLTSESHALNSQQKLMKMNWQVLKPQNVKKDCFWANKQKELNVVKKDIFDDLTQQFSVPNKRTRNVSIGKPQIDLRVLDKNAAQNILISFHGLFKKLTHEQIKNEILKCDHTILNTVFIEALIKFLPPYHKMKQLHDLKKEGATLADVEQFVATLSDIERLVPRLECINFKAGFNGMMKDLEPSIEVGTNACREIVSSNKFGRILKLILSIGNFMNNSGPNNATALGFELNSLNKLNEIKSVDTKRTLLNFIVDKIQDTMPDLLDFSSELPHIEQAAKMDFEMIEKSIDNIHTLATNLRKEIKMDRALQKFSFPGEMVAFSCLTDVSIENLPKIMAEMKHSYTEVAHHFAFDTNKYPMKECFLDLSNFVSMFQKTHEEIVGSREAKKLKAGTYLLLKIPKYI